MARVIQFVNKFWRQLVYLRYKGYFHFVGGNVLKIAFLYTLVIIALVYIGRSLLDLNQIFGQIVEIYSDVEVLVIFFVAEATLGCIPPDLFMMWTAKFTHPVAMLALLGVLSYGGGIVAYYLGSWLAQRKKIRAFIERRLRRYIRLTQKWGGAFITIAALFPFTPYPLVIIAVSMLKYPVRKLYIFGLTRIIRFVVQGMIMINVLDISF